MMRQTINPEKIRLLAMDGMTAPQIAAEIGYSVGAVRTCGAKHNIDCAARLLDAIDARDAAVADVKNTRI